MPMTTEPRTLVVGAGGLLGRNVLAATDGLRPVPAIRWTDPDAVRSDLRDVVSAVSKDGRPVRVAWCAGIGVVGSAAEVMDQEAGVFARFLDELTRQSAPVSSFFLASSAGAVYARTPRPVIDESCAVAANSAYGDGTLRKEQSVTAWAREHRVPTLIGRISNLYGAGHNLNKPQGLISRLVRSSLLREPLPIYVALDTRRDYLYAPDAGRIIGHALAEIEAGVPAVVTRIIASGRSTTVAELLNELGRIRKRRVPAVHARNPLTDLQPRTLAFASIHPDPVRRTPLTVGLSAVVADQLAQLQAGKLT